MGAPISPSSVPRARGAVVFLMLALSLGAAFFASAATGPTFDEERRIAAVRHATDLARAFGQFGPSTLVSSSARGVYDDLAPFGIVPGLLSGWLGQVLSDARVLDALTAARFGWLLLAGLGPFALFLLVSESRGPRLGFLSACLLVATPRFLHAVGAAREPAIVTSLWLLLFSLYRLSVPRPAAERRAGGARRHFLYAVLFAAVLALGMAVNLATLWALPVIIGHYFCTRLRRVWPALRRGRAPLPSAFVWVLVLTPALLVLLVPTLWRGGAVSGAEWLFSPLAPTIEPLLYGAPVVSFKDVPASYAAHILAVTTPVATLTLFVAGLGVSVHDRLRVRRGEARKDPSALVGLSVFMIAAACLGPLVTPRVLTRFPPRFETALPFVAVLAAIALDRAAMALAVRFTRDPRIATRAVVLAGVAIVALGVRDLKTASASFSLLSRGTPGAVAARVFTIGDGSEVAPLARSIDALGLGEMAPPTGEVSRAYFSLLNQTGRMKTRIGSRGALDLAVSRGQKPGAVGSVSRDGAVLWSVSKR